MCSTGFFLSRGKSAIGASHAHPHLSTHAEADLACLHIRWQMLAWVMLDSDPRVSAAFTKKLSMAVRTAK
eukprot:27991-Eustigmatos_ZCMA.PRE.1